MLLLLKVRHYLILIIRGIVALQFGYYYSIYIIIQNLIQSYTQVKNGDYLTSTIYSITCYFQLDTHTCDNSASF